MERVALTSDYAGNKVDLKPRLEAIANAGFSHYMHCHGWNSAEHYARTDMLSIKEWTRDIKISTVDVHASIGPNKEVYSQDQDIQDTGIELVLNRVALAETLETDVAVLHIPSNPSKSPQFWDTVDRFITKVEPELHKSGVKLAFENLDQRPNLPSNFPVIHELLKRYPTNLIGLCYDSGHGNVDGDGIENLTILKDRLLAVHLHDNYGKNDEHNLIFDGTVDWKTLSQVLAESSYAKPLSSESSMSDSLGQIGNETHFLGEALFSLSVISDMVEVKAIVRNQ